MRGHLSLGEVKPEDVSEDTIQAVAETLKTSTFLKLSEDGELLKMIEWSLHSILLFSDSSLLFVQGQRLVELPSLQSPRKSLSS